MGKKGKQGEVRQLQINVEYLLPSHKCLGPEIFQILIFFFRFWNTGIIYQEISWGKGIQVWWDRFGGRRGQ
jgi:hypothetical protein